jgi:hypothetical protein
MKRRFGVLDREKSRMAAIPAIKVLRKVAKDAGDDLGVIALDVNKMHYALDLLEQSLSEILPPAGAEPKTILLFPGETIADLGEVDTRAADEDGDEHETEEK